MAELAFIELLRAIATDPAARGLADDAALLEVGSERLVLTHDTLVESVHFLPDDSPEDVAWKLVAVNVSDLAAKGVSPMAALMGYTLAGDDHWDARFVDGLAQALATFAVPLIGGDTVAARERHLGLTMIGRATGTVPSRSGAHEGDALFVTGTIGDAAAGLAIAKAGQIGNPDLLAAYRRPTPQCAAGAVLAPVVTAMMDVSDGLLIDAARMAEASGCAVAIDLDAVPLSAAFIAARGGDRAARLAAVTGGDDYQLLFASALPLPPMPCPVARIGRFLGGNGLRLHDSNGEMPVPVRLGWEH